MIKKVFTVLLVVACGGFAFLMMTTKTGLVPNEDMGTVFIDVRTSPGNSVQETRKVMVQVDSCLRTIPQVELYSKTTVDTISRNHRTRKRHNICT